MEIHKKSKLPEAGEQVIEVKREDEEEGERGLSGVTTYKAPQGFVGLGMSAAAFKPKRKPGTTWKLCGFTGCSYGTTQSPANLRRHRAAIHGILEDAPIVKAPSKACGVKGCEYVTKYGGGDLTKHRARVHNIGVRWFDCPEEGCTYNVKQEGNIKRHRALVHGIGVTWYECPGKDCTFKAKQVSSKGWWSARAMRRDTRAMRRDTRAMRRTRTCVQCAPLCAPPHTSAPPLRTAI